VGEWYDGLDGAFRVVAFDDVLGAIEIQYFDSSLEELELDAWYELALNQVPPPEDWSGPFDDIEPIDMDDTEEAMRPHDWSSPLDGL
jgi:hypothetical protein